MIHTDRSPEFQGTVKELAAKLNINMIHSRPYYPKSQGKIESSHSTWKCKLSKHEELLQALSTEPPPPPPCHNVAYVAQFQLKMAS